MKESAQRIDGLIKAGQTTLARAELRRLRASEIPRAVLWQVASLALRANAAGFALKLLYPLVRPEHAEASEPSPQEKIQFAVALIRIGAIGEALGILDSQDGAQFPEVLFYKSLGLVGQWDYEATIPLLSQYVRSPQIDDYMRLVGRVNLAAAWVHTQNSSEANRLLPLLLEEALSKKLSLIVSNLLELSTENAIVQRRWDRARKFLRMACDQIRDKEGPSAFFFRKWEAILELLRTKASQSAVSMLKMIRKEAFQRKHWETIRDCDFFWASATRDRRLLIHLYFGTPFSSFKRRIIRELDGQALPKEYIWTFSSKKQPKIIVDIDAEDLSTGLGLKPGMAMHRLFVTLTSDFYRPFRLANLHASIYPRERFNPHTSPFRVHQVKERLRNWFEETCIPLSIVEKNRLYELAASGVCAIRVKEQKTLSLTGKRLSTLRRTFKSETFSAGEAATVLGLSKRRTHHLLSEGIRNGAVTRSGTSAYTRYLLEREKEE